MHLAFHRKHEFRTRRRESLRVWKKILPMLACLLIGCGSEVLEETTEQTYKIDPTASISISNVDGSVLVYGWDRAEMTVEATKRAYSKSQLNKIDIVISVQPGSASIETKFPPRPKWSFSDRSGTVDYIVLIPQTANIARLELDTGELLIRDMRGGPSRAELGNGVLYVHNCFCDLDLKIHRGALGAFFDWWEPKKFSLNAEIQNAKSLFMLPGEASFHLMAETDTGNIDNDFAEQEERVPGGVSKIDKIIGEAPNAEIKIHAVDGNIEISEQNP